MRLNVYEDMVRIKPERPQAYIQICQCLGLHSAS